MDPRLSPPLTVRLPSTTSMSPATSAMVPADSRSVALTAMLPALTISPKLPGDSKKLPTVTDEATNVPSSAMSLVTVPGLGKVNSGMPRLNEPIPKLPVSVTPPTTARRCAVAGPVTSIAPVPGPTMVAISLLPGDATAVPAVVTSYQFAGRLHAPEPAAIQLNVSPMTQPHWPASAPTRACARGAYRRGWYIGRAQSATRLGCAIPLI